MLKLSKTSVTVLALTNGSWLLEYVGLPEIRVPLNVKPGSRSWYAGYSVGNVTPDIVAVQPFDPITGPVCW